MGKHDKGIQTHKYVSNNKNFEDFQKTPNIETIATIMVYGLNSSPNLHLFPEKSDTKSLLEGSLYAIEAVTKNIANSMESETVASDLTSQLTENCQRNLETAMNEKSLSNNILINNEDIIFSWLGKYDESQMKMKICTFSFPSYHYLRRKLQEQDKLEKQLVNDQIET